MNINDRYKSSGIASPYNLKQSLDRFFDDISNTSPKSIVKNQRLNLFEPPAISGTPLQWDLTGTGYFQYIDSNTASGSIGTGSSFSQNISEKLLPNTPYTVLVYASMPVTGIEFSVTADNDSQIFNLQQGSTEINSATITADVTSASKYVIQFSTNVVEVSGGVYFNISNPTGSDVDITIKYTSIYRGLIEFGETTDISDVYYAEVAGLAVSATNLIDKYTPMVTKWLLTDDNEIELPLPIAGSYDFIVDWGDGNTNAVTAYDSGNSHTYATSGVKTVTITGLMTQWRFPMFHYSAEKLTHVVKTGYTGLTSLYQGFFLCQNLIYIENDPIWTKNVTNMGDMLRSCTSFNSDISDWNTSNVTDMSGMFFGATSFNQSIDSWDVSKVTNMYQMFRGASVFNQPLNSWNVHNVTDISFMFYEATLFDKDLYSWDVSNVNNLYGTFSLSNFNGNINNWDVSNVNNMQETFDEANIFNQPLNLWNTSSVTAMQDMFNGAFAFNQDISSWDVSNVINMQYMFSSAHAFNQDISSWDVGNVTNMTNMFSAAGVSTNPTAFNQSLNSWDFSNVVSMNGMFKGPTAYNQPINWNTSSINDTSYMFYRSTFNASIILNTSSVSSMAFMFYSDSNFNQDISSWSVSSIDNTLSYSMSHMIESTAWISLNYDLALNSWASQPVQTGVYFDCGPTAYTEAGSASRDYLINTKGWIITDGGLEAGYEPMITEWSLTTDNSVTLPLPVAGTYDFIVDWGDGNTNPVTAYNSGNQHTYATSGIKTVSVTGLMTHWSFNNTGDKLKITSVLSGGYSGLTSLAGGFYGCSNLTFIENNPIWTKNVTTMDSIFRTATSFNSDISGWDTSNVTNMSAMFYDAASFNSDISGWDTSNVNNMFEMFKNATSFNQDISGWNTDSLIYVASLFNGATSFNQPLNSWNVSNVTFMVLMFNNATSFNQPLNSWNVSNVTDMVSMFNNATLFNQDISGWNFNNLSGSNSLLNMLDNTAMSELYYSSLLLAWWANEANLPDNMTVGVNGLVYTYGSEEPAGTAEEARGFLITYKGWTFVGDSVGV
jgi:surface protein